MPRILPITKLSTPFKNSKLRVGTLSVGSYRNFLLQAAHTYATRGKFVHCGGRQAGASTPVISPPTSRVPLRAVHGRRSAQRGPHGGGAAAGLVPRSRADRRAAGRAARPTTYLAHSARTIAAIPLPFSLPSSSSSPRSGSRSCSSSSSSPPCPRSIHLHLVTRQCPWFMAMSVQRWAWGWARPKSRTLSRRKRGIRSSR